MKELVKSAKETKDKEPRVCETSLWDGYDKQFLLKIDLKGEEEVTEQDLDSFGNDLTRCKSFKVIIHTFNSGILKKLVLIRNKFKRKCEDDIEFNFGAEFTNDALD